MNLAQIKAAAPANPPCFKDAESWLGYLLSCQQQSSQKPFKQGEFRAEFNFCADCSLEHTTRMSRDGRCNPSHFREIRIHPKQVPA